MKTGLVVEGGGMKCAYSAGILDRFLDEHITFDYCIGVSAGSANTASYLAGQRGRNRRFYVEHLMEPGYMGVKNLLRTGQFFGLQYIYATLTNSDGADPIDYPAIVANSAEFELVATDAATGKAAYFNKDDMKQDDYRAILDNRHLMYRQNIADVKKHEAAGESLVFAPSRELKMSTYARNIKLEEELYDLGISDFDARLEELHAFLS